MSAEDDDGLNAARGIVNATLISFALGLFIMGGWMAATGLESQGALMMLVSAAICAGVVIMVGDK